MQVLFVDDGESVSGPVGYPSLESETVFVQDTGDHWMLYDFGDEIKRRHIGPECVERVIDATGDKPEEISWGELNVYSTFTDPWVCPF